LDNSVAHADKVYKKDGPFYCPSCLCEVVVRKCTNKVNHFAHHARQSSILTKKDKALHDNCRNEILNCLKKEFPDGNWEKERPIHANAAKGFKMIVPDISGRINEIPVAIEVQVSKYTVNRIKTKLIEYEKRKEKVAVLYLVPLKEELGPEGFRPRLFEKYLHSIYGGRVYYWTKGSGLVLQPVHFSPTTRLIEASTWYDIEIHDYRSVGGYFLTYRTIKKPNYGKPVDIAKDFIKHPKLYWEPKNVKHAIPHCTIFKDNLQKWWVKNEGLSSKQQAEKHKMKMVQEIREKYELEDDYDEIT
jgi:competence protein CoiA